jgi:hypothetical protein
MIAETIKVHDNPFAEVGRITLEGHTFDAWGAVEEPGGILFCYVRQGADGWTVGNWDGSVTFGRIITRHDYRASGFGGAIRMRSLRVRRPDRFVWTGRYGYDWRDCVRLRRAR